MKSKKIDGVEVWKQYEDLAVPQLKLSVHERAVYTHLLRHSRIEGNDRLRFSISWLRHGTALTIRAARKAVRGLVAKGALRVVGRGREGHLVEVRLPGEIRGIRAGLIQTKGTSCEETRAPELEDLEETDFLGSKILREAIHGREGGRCFYCGRRMGRRARCLDHVVPLAHLGGNSYRNLVSSCVGCNAQKREWKAEDFVRWLYREGRLSDADLKGRLRSLEALAAGKLRPRIEGSPGSNPAKRKRFAARAAS